jgi:dimethylsulfone monooxygenase
VDMILCGFLNYDWELEQFGRRVIPLVRERERELESRRLTAVGG